MPALSVKKTPRTTNILHYVIDEGKQSKLSCSIVDFDKHNKQVDEADVVTFRTGLKVTNQETSTYAFNCVRCNLELN